MYESESFFRKRRSGPSVTSLLLAAVGLSSLAWVVWGQNTNTPDAAPEPRAITPRGDLAADEWATIQIFEQTSKSVVNVSPTARVRQNPFSRNVTEVEVGTGSGFIWDREGHIVTNFHVVEPGRQWKVSLQDGNSYNAKLVGFFVDKDIAVLRVDAPPDSLTPIMIGTSKDLQVGQKVLAIGNPFGLDHSLSTGVVSALNREFPALNGKTIEGVIQTDSAINPGNSGGPLLDSSGRLIGMNTAIYSNTGQSAGIGFAVPVDVINDVVPQLIAHGGIARPGLGVMIYDDMIAKRLGYSGVLIREVTSGSSAEKAGLRGTTQLRNGEVELGDIVIKINEFAIPGGDVMRNVLDRFKVGDTVEVTVLRNDEPMTVKVTLQGIKDQRP